MKIYNIAVIGTGFMGRTHSFAYASLPFFFPDSECGARLYTVCGTTPEKAEKIRKNCGFEYATTDFERIISDKSIDIIDICTPNALHYSQCKAAIESGKAVYCEKPLAVTYEQARELAGLADEKGITAGVAFQNRAWCAVKKAKELIDSGAIGEIISFRAAYLHASSVDKSKPYAWRYCPVSEGGGVLFDLGSHAIDLVRYLGGEIGEVRAMTHTLHKQRTDSDGNTHAVTSDDAVFMTARLVNGAPGTIEASKLATGIGDGLRIDIHGEKGAVFFDLTKPNELGVYLDGERKTLDCMQKYPSPCAFLTGSQSAGWIRAHIHSTQSFLSAVHTGLPAGPSFADGAEVIRVIERARESSNC